MENQLNKDLENLELDEIFCNVCNQKILNYENEVRNERNFYHKSCLKCADCLNESKDENQVDILDINSIRFKNGKVFCKKHSLERRYSSLYFQPTLISQIAIPKFKEIKYKIMKNCFSDMIPQICLHFPISEKEAKIFVKNGGIEKIKKEVQTMLGTDYEVYLQSIEIGSIFAKFGILLKKVKMGAQKIKQFLFGKNEEKTKIIQKSMEIIRSSSFSSIKNPDAISFVNQSSFENYEQNKVKIKNYLSEQINKKEEDEKSVSSTTTMGSINESEITDKEYEFVESELEKILNEDEKNLKEEIDLWEKTSALSKKFEKELENAFKDSIFEFRRTGLCIINKEEFAKEYEDNKNSCQNCETKFLFHGTKIAYSSCILTDNFKVGKDCWYGLGIYFTDQLEYARYYWNGWANINKIPKINESFSVVASEIFYDKTKFKQIYDYKLRIVLEEPPKDKDIFGKYKGKIVEKNGIHYAEVEGIGTKVITEDKRILINHNVYNNLSPKLFRGREYVITYKEQILPTYGLTFQRNDFCIIWRDSNFLAGNLYSKELEEYKKYAREMQNFNLYTASSTLEALKLVWKKKYNKIILISNCGEKINNEHEGKIFADKARKILGFNAFILFFGSWIGHLNWVKNYPNSLYTNSPKYYYDYILNYNEEGLNRLKSEVEKYIHSYPAYSDFKFLDFKDHLLFPLFEKFKNGGKYSELDCSDYIDN